MAVTVLIRARIRGDHASARKLHDDVTRATKEMALAAGDVSHKVFLDPRDPKAFLGIDVWKSPEDVQKFSSQPQIRDFFGNLFEGEPEVTLWIDSGWNQW